MRSWYKKKAPTLSQNKKKKLLSPILSPSSRVCRGVFLVLGREVREVQVWMGSSYVLLGFFIANKVVLRGLVHQGTSILRRALIFLHGNFLAVGQALF